MSKTVWRCHTLIASFQPYSQILDLLETNVLGTNTLAYFDVASEQKIMFCYIGPWASYYKTFYGLNLQVLVISYSACPWQAIPT
jgi:hypothetical protein